MKSHVNFVLCIAVLGAGCGSSAPATTDDTTTTTTTTDTAGGDTTTTTTTVVEPPPPPPPPAPAHARLIHASPDAAAAAAAIYMDGSATPSVASLAYKASTEYMDVPPGAHTVAIRPAAAAADSAPTFSGSAPELASGTSYTVIAYGLTTGTPAMALAAAADDGAAVEAGHAHLRFFHALVGLPNADICVAGATARAPGTPVFTNVAFGAWGTAAGDGASGNWAAMATGAAAHVQVREANTTTPCSGRVLGRLDMTATDGNWTAIAVGNASSHPAVAKEMLVVKDGESAITTIAIGR